MRLSKSTVNRIIDRNVHPVARKRDWRFWLLDFALHMLNERDPGSLRKGIEFYSPHLVRKLARRWENHHGGSR